jgi:hypothetical protein
MKNKIISILAMALISLLYSCNSPLDINTPRKTIIKGSPRIEPKIISLNIEENGINKVYSVDSLFIQIDTTYEIPIIWLSLKLKSQTSNTLNFENINVSAFYINVDSNALASKPITFENTRNNKSFTKILLSRGLAATYDTLILCDPVINVTEMSFALDKKHRELWAFLYSKIYDYKISLIKRDTIVRDTVDELFYDTVWINKSEFYLKERWEKVEKEIKLTIEEERRVKDSLFIRGKLKFEYK